MLAPVAPRPRPAVAALGAGGLLLVAALATLFLTPGLAQDACADWAADRGAPTFEFSAGDKRDNCVATFGNGSTAATTANAPWWTTVAVMGLLAAGAAAVLLAGRLGVWRLLTRRGPRAVS